MIDRRTKPSKALSAARKAKLMEAHAAALEAVQVLKAAENIPDDDAPPRACPRLIAKREVLELIGVSYPTIWKWMQEGIFPRSRQLGINKTVWLESEIYAWINALPRRPIKGDEKVAR